MKFSLTSLFFLSFLLVALLTAVTLNSQIQSSTGYIGSTKKPDQSAGGCFCHYPEPESSVNAGIKGPKIVNPGSTNEYIVWVTKGTNKAAGFNVSSWLGDLNTKDKHASKIVNELTQSLPKSSPKDSDTISWTFSYKAPLQEGTDTLYATGMNVDSAGDTKNDHWNFAPNFIIKIAGITGLDEENEIRKNIQVYPNPASGFSNLKIKLLNDGIYDIWLQNSNGCRIKDIASRQLKKGENSIGLDLKEIPGGQYFIVINSASYRITKPIIISF